MGRSVGMSPGTHLRILSALAAVLVWTAGPACAPTGDQDADPPIGSGDDDAADDDSGGDDDSAGPRETREEVPPWSSGGRVLTTAVYAGRVSLPEGTGVLPGDLRVHSAFGGTVAPAEDGSFSVRMNTDAVGLVSLRTADGSLVATSAFPKHPDLVATTVDLSADSTARTLVWMAVGTRLRDPRLAALLQEHAASLPEFGSLRAELEAAMAEDPHALGDLPEPVVAALDAVVRALLPNAGARAGAAATGDTEQPWFADEDGADRDAVEVTATHDSDWQEISLGFRHDRNRWVFFWASADDGMGGAGVDALAGVVGPGGWQVPGLKDLFLDVVLGSLWDRYADMFHDPDQGFYDTLLERLDAEAYFVAEGAGGFPLAGYERGALRSYGWGDGMASDATTRSTMAAALTTLTEVVLPWTAVVLDVREVAGLSASEVAEDADDLVEILAGKASSISLALFECDVYLAAGDYSSAFHTLASLAEDLLTDPDLLAWALWRLDLDLALVVKLALAEALETLGGVLKLLDASLAALDAVVQTVGVLRLGDQVDAVDSYRVDATDRDADGYAGTVFGGEDCDDADPSVNPDADETCGDGVDQDCSEDGDGARECEDADCAGDPACAVPDAACGNGLDDDGDGWTDLADPGCGGDPDGTDEGGLDPGRPCNDGVDNDGDGGVDAGDPDCADGDGEEATEDPAGPRIDSISPASALQGDMVEVTLLGEGFVDDGGPPRVYAGAGVLVLSATYVSPAEIRATFRIGCDVPAGPVTVEYALPEEPWGTGCESAGRACSTGFSVDAGPACAVDADGDGVPAAEDCDDGDALAGEVGVEVCDGDDDDCDGGVDEGCTGPTHHSGTITGAEIWTRAGSPHVLDGSVTVEGGATLTVEAGATVQAVGGALSVAGRLYATGCAELPVRFDSAAGSPAPGDWWGISFQDGAAGGALEHVQVSYAGTGIAVGSGADPAIRDVTVTDCTGAGIQLLGEPPAAGDDPSRLAENAVTRCGSYAVWASLGRLARLDPSNHFTGNAWDAVGIAGSMFAGSVVVPALPVPYHAVYGITVAGPGASVELAPGARVEAWGYVWVGDGAQEGSLLVDPGATLAFHGYALVVTATGLLWAGGDAASPAVFTSAADSPAPGDWWGIDFQDGSAGGALEHVQVSYAGTGITVGSGADPAIRDVTVTDCSGAGVQLLGEPPAAGDDPSRLAENAVTRCGSYAVWASLGRLARLDPSNHFTGNAWDAVGIADSTFAGSVVVPALPVPYHAVYGITVAGPGASVELAPGARVEAWGYVWVGDGAQEGSLLVDPGATLAFHGNALVVTATGDLSGMGTFESAAEAPIAGDWWGILLQEGSRAEIAGATVRHAGTCIDISPGEHAVTGSAIGPCSGYGIAVQPGATPFLAGNTYSDTGLGDVFYF